MYDKSMFWRIGVGDKRTRLAYNVHMLYNTLHFSSLVHTRIRSLVPFTSEIELAL